eukprot:6492685-Amphidinium_carterae.5
MAEICGLHHPSAVSESLRNLLSQRNNHTHSASKDLCLSDMHELESAAGFCWSDFFMFIFVR